MSTSPAPGPVLRPEAQRLRERVLPRVQKPGRYVGGEWNQVVKPAGSVQTRVALAFPDVYEIGVSYLGFQILYELLNQEADVAAERVYSPWPDAERWLREEALPLGSLESFTPLAEFDWVGITLQNELCYSNVLTLLDLGGIPLVAADRSDLHPLVIAGGPVCSNAEPVAAVFDLMVLGDGEQVFLELIRKDRAIRSRSRKERLAALALVPGVYVPSLYQPVYAADGKLERITAAAGAPVPVRRRFEPAPARPSRPLLPTIAVTHDRVSVELFRGCCHGCRFCQAGMITRPVRERDPEAVIAQVQAALAATGYEEASLTSLSSGDYTQLLPLVRGLMQELSPRRVALSFPSLRLDSFQRELAEAVAEVRKTGLTFAPEAGSERLRRVINKAMDEAGFTRSLGQVFAEGWDLIKLYFMLGLPTETETDVQAISDLVKRILAAARKQSQGRRGPRINLGVALFVPKPHTPFQWEPQLPRDQARARLQQLAHQLPRAAGFEYGRLNELDLDKSYLEAVLARGDRRLWPAIQRVWELGARFDNWSEHFQFPRWQQAFQECGIATEPYALRTRERGEVFPWDHLDLGVSRAYLWKERERAGREEVTPDCRLEGKCNGCGVLDPRECPLPPAPVRALAAPPASSVVRPERERVRLRLRYSKAGDLRFVGHLDLVNAFRRAARRADLPVHYSIGFHPQPALAFGPPLSLGFSGLAEWLDLGLDRWLEATAVIEAWNQKLPNGLRLEGGREVPLSTPALAEQINGGDYWLEWPEGFSETHELEARFQEFWGQSEVWAEQWSKSGTLKVNCRPSVVSGQVERRFGRTGLRLLHRTETHGTVKLSTLVEHFCFGAIEPWQVQVTRTTSGRLVQNAVVVP